MAPKVWGGDTIEDVDGNVGVVVTTAYSLRGAETVYEISKGGRRGGELKVPESKVARVLAHRAHEYRSSPERVCAYCGAKKREHGDGTRARP